MRPKPSKPDRFTTYAEWQKYHRLAARYSLRELASEVSKSHTYVAKLEQDDSQPDEISPRPPREYVRAVASLLDADVDEGLRLAGWERAETDENATPIREAARSLIKARYHGAVPAELGGDAEKRLEMAIETAFEVWLRDQERSGKGRRGQ